jgi:hypothetical protein
MNFVEVVKAILVQEHQRTENDADMLVKRFPNVMVNAMMAGNGNEVRACAMALEMAESAARKLLREGNAKEKS